MKTILHFLARIFFRFRAFNTEVLDTPGPVLLIPNHVSWFDWLFLGVVLDEDWKFVTSATTAQSSWFHRKAMINSRTFPIDTLSPYSVRDMAAHLKQGGRLVLFAEGRISRTGELMKLFDGTGFLLHKTGAKVICAHLRNANRMPFSPNVTLKRWFPTVTAHFSEVFTPPVFENLSASKARGVYTRWLRDQMVGLRFDTEMNFGPSNLPAAIVETAQIYAHKPILEDINLKALTYERFLAGAGALANGLADRLAHGGGRIGVLLPNTNALPVSLMALWRLNKVPAILNYSVGIATLHACSDVAGLKQVITSRVFLEKIKLDPAQIEKGGPELIFLEDVREQIGTMERLIALAGAKFNPSAHYRGIPAEETAVVLFTSGSEGVPKGVELTHRNLLANIRQILSVLDLQDDDRFFNSLPMFHSFGLTGATLLPLVRGLYSFVYPSPLHYRVVPTAFYNTNCTVLFGTNTFINGYARKAHSYDFRNLRYLMAGAEKIQAKTAEIWAQRYGVRVMEGYGATECAPALCTNTPMEPKHGSTGRLLPRIEHRLESVEGVDRGGRLFVKGPNIMKGYLNRDANKQFQKLDGWYDTGDIVDIDEEGFVHILGRLKRFAKVSGEMVGLTAVEDALAGAFPKYGIRCQIAVIARPDPDKGERLIAVCNEKRLTVKEMREVLKEKGHSNLWVPREVIFVNEIPKLGTGKVNHRELMKKLKA
jgi:acyl-[acyl-carrier-protein]-phospholipid O-acyltransferase / long-chain-fatty-acid--[acyl-carrier-protein] ligase